MLPVFEEDDIVFNSSMLKTFIEQMISAGKRNFAIDMSPLDDFSTGDNNALRELNKKILSLNGTFKLLSPQPRVVGILQRMDIPSIIGVYNTENELMALSEEIRKQQPKQTEYESLRSEIGNAFGDMHLQGTSPAAVPPVPPPTAPRSFDAFEVEAVTPTVTPVPPPPAMPKAPAPSFDSFEMEPVTPTITPVPPPPPAAAPKSFDDFEIESVTPAVSDVPPPKAPAFGPPEPRTDALSPSFSDSSPETQRFPEAPALSAAKAQPAVKDFGISLNDDDDDEFVKPKKGFPVIALVAVLVLLVLGAGGYFFFVMEKDEAKPAPVAATPPPAPVPEPPAPESEETSVATVEATEAEPAKASAPAPVAKAPAPAPAAKAPAPAPAAKAPAPAPVAKAPAPAAKAPAPAPAAKAPTPAPAPAPAAPAQRNQIIITSNPSGASIEIDGEPKGVTPYTWTTPFFGDMVITVFKAGFAKQSKTVDYTGGSQTHAFTLQRPSQAAPAPAPAAAARPAPAPAPAAPPPPPPPAAAPPPPPPPPAAAGASIFIATLPSHADVYIGGRLIGKSNDAELQVPVGTHQVRFVKDGLEKTESITFQPGKNPTRFVNLR